MAFVKKTWKDRISQYPNRRTINDGFQTKIVTVGRSEGSVTEAGDSFNAENMNDLEDRINEAFTNIVHMPRVNDKVPYQYRQTPVKADRCIEKLIGVSCAFNQLVQNGNFSDNSNWSMTRGTLSVSDNIGTITINNGETRAHAQASLSLTIGHKYLIIGTGKYDTYSDNMNKAIMQVFYGSDTDYSLFNVSNNSWNTYSTIFTCVSNQYNFLRIYNNNVGNLSHFENIMCFDLTAMLGSEVADYLYKLESNTAGSGIALFRQLFPEDYYAYQTATLISSKPVAKKVVGFNQWNEHWEIGGINGSGQPDTATNRIRSVDFIPLVPNTTYYIKAPNNCGTYFYDDNQAFISADVYANETITPPANARYLKFTPNSQYGTAYHNDICLNISDANKNGTYEPYEEHTYPLGGDELRGLLKVENGQLVAYGDVKPSDGNGTEYFDIVDLGTLNYVYDSENQTFVCANQVVIKTQSGILSDIYETIVASTWSSMTDMSVMRHPTVNNIFRIKNLAYSDAATFKTAMSGKYLIYEKATPTAKSYTPFTNPMICGSTEEFTDSRSVKMPCGHDSYYEKDLIVPNTPTADGTYTLKCTVVSGEPTLNWQADT